MHFLVMLFLLLVSSLDLHFSSLGGKAESWAAEREKRRNAALPDNQKEPDKRESFYSGHAGSGIHYHRSDSVC